jgi:hypothetical protein
MSHARADGCPGDAACGIVDVDDELTGHHAVAECHDARAVLQFCIGDKPGRHPRMQRPDVAQRAPYLLGRRVDGYFAVNGGYCRFSCAGKSPSRPMLGGQTQPVLENLALGAAGAPEALGRHPCRAVEGAHEVRQVVEPHVECDAGDGARAVG